MSAYRTNFGREDPRLNRQTAPHTSPKATKSPNSSSATNNSQSFADGWNTQTASYNHTTALQNAYQSLPYHNAAAAGHHYPTQTYYTGYQNYSYNPYENYQASQQAAQVYTTTPAAALGTRASGEEEYPHGAWTSSSNDYSGGVGAVTTIIKSHPGLITTGPIESGNTSAVSAGQRKSDAIAEEKIKQLAGLVKERATYEDRVASLKKKLRLLHAQKDDLASKGLPDKENLRILKENTLLQVEIQGKIKDATNVIDILSNLIGDKKKSRTDVPSEDSFATLRPGVKINFKHFDPEVHWCRLCDVFPQSAKELLLHLHSKEHQAAGGVQDEVPWHKLPAEPKFPTYEGAPIRRVPIKGLQFFVASTAWYCRLCDVWIGDLHCASQHLMSVGHSQNYANFVGQNPRWESEWMKDREKALERLNKGDKYSSPTAMAESHESKKKKRKSKRRRKSSSDESSSSSSSSSPSSTSDEEVDKTKSIRVAMRNKLLESGGKIDILEKITRKGHAQSQNHGKNKDDNEDKLLSQWMTTNEPLKDKKLLDNLKEKLKQKQDAEKTKLALETEELLRKQKEREETDKKQKVLMEREELLAKEEEKHREKMSLKLRAQPSIRDTYRRRSSSSRSPGRLRRRHSSRSVSPPASSRRASNRNGGRDYDDRSPRYNRRRSRSRGRCRSRSKYSRSRSRDRRREHSHDKDQDCKKTLGNKKLPFIGRMPLFKNTKLIGSAVSGKGKEDEKREIQKEEYEPPRKTRFQPGNLARAFIPQPEVVCFPQLSSLPPVAPPPPPISTTPTLVLKAVSPPEAPKISTPKPPSPPKIEQKLPDKAERALMEAAREEAEEEEDDDDEDEGNNTAEGTSVYADALQGSTSEEYMLYGDASNIMYQYASVGSMDYSVLYPATQQTYNYYTEETQEAQTSAQVDEPPKSHTLPLEPPPLPPDDPNDDLEMLGISSDDMAVQQMF